MCAEADREPDWLATLLPQLYTIPGWFTATDARLFALVGRLQIERGIRGDALEIGTYLGKSATVLGFLLNDGEGEGEELHVCDPFETVDLGDYVHTVGEGEFDDLQQATFEANYLRFHKDLPTIHACTSARLESRIGSRQFRIIHIDGSHAFDDVVLDTELALRHLEPGGIVIFDDAQNWRTPGTIAAVWTEVGNKRIRPLFLTAGKLYAAVDDVYSFESLRDAINATPRLAADEWTAINETQTLVVRTTFEDSGGSGLKRLARRWLSPHAMATLANTRRRLLRRPTT